MPHTNYEKSPLPQYTGTEFQWNTYLPSILVALYNYELLALIKTILERHKQKIK